MNLCNVKAIPMNLCNVKAILRCVRHTGSDTSKSDATTQIDDLISSVLHTTSYKQTNKHCLNIGTYQHEKTRLIESNVVTAC